MAKGRRRNLATTTKDAEEDIELTDQDDPDEGHLIATTLVKKYIRMWPRSIFNTPEEGHDHHRGKRPSIGRMSDDLNEPGVYILYRDDEPFYVGQAKGKLRSRLRAHANQVGSRRSYFWNYFSAFIVENPQHIDEVEAILIAAMPSAITNNSTPKLPRAKMGPSTMKLMRELRSRGQY